MSIDGETVWLIVGLVVLMLLLTGPGMWSSKWGWFKRGKRKD
jgi:hypothetical protein